MTIYGDFTYDDQFGNMEVNLTPYLDLIYTNSNFKYAFTNKQSVKTTLSNLFHKTSVVRNFKDNILYFDAHQIQEGEKIEIISNRVYGTLYHWWVICIFNNIKNLYNDWPMTEEQLQTMADMLYTKYGYYTRSVYYDLLFERNEKRRTILILKPFYLNSVVTAFRTEFEKTGI